MLILVCCFLLVFGCRLWILSSPKTFKCFIFCLYLVFYFTKLDQVELGPEDYFFRSLERGKFTRRRLGYKKFGCFCKEAAFLMVTIQKTFQVLFLVEISRFCCFVRTFWSSEFDVNFGCWWCNVCTCASSWSLG